MRMLLIATWGALLLLIAPASAQVIGRYNVEGQNPDGSNYAGTAAVEKQGEAYRVTWNISGARFIGTAIGGDDALAITYRSGNNTGVALLIKDERNYVLVWTYAGGTTLGGEKWSRR
jgi:hypothetical protein